MFKSKKRKKMFKLAKAEQREILKNSAEEAIILTLVFGILVILFDNEVVYFFKSISSLKNLERLEIIVLFIPIFLILSIIYTTIKVIVTRKK